MIAFLPATMLVLGFESQLSNSNKNKCSVAEKIDEFSSASVIGLFQLLASLSGTKMYLVFVYAISLDDLRKLSIAFFCELLVLQITAHFISMLFIFLADLSFLYLYVFRSPQCYGSMTFLYGSGFAVSCL